MRIIPSISYVWSNFYFNRSKSGSSYLERGRESRLVIDNITYDFQGEYECRATNYINGQERTVASEPILLQVVGKCYFCFYSAFISSLLTVFINSTHAICIKRMQFNLYKKKITNFVGLTLFHFVAYLGAPQILRTTSHSVSVHRGDEAILTLIVCADPRPRHVAWEWGSLRLEVGASFGIKHVF